MGKAKKKNRRSDGNLQDLATPVLSTDIAEPISAPQELIERLGECDQVCKPALPHDLPLSSYAFGTSS